MSDISFGEQDEVGAVQPLELRIMAVEGAKESINIWRDSLPSSLEEDRPKPVGAGLAVECIRRKAWWISV